MTDETIYEVIDESLLAKEYEPHGHNHNPSGTVTKYWHKDGKRYSITILEEDE